MKFVLYVLGALAAVSLLYRLVQARTATPAARDRRTKPIGGDARHYGPSWLFGGDSPPHGNRGGSSHDPGDAGSSHNFGTDYNAGFDTGGFDSGGGGDGGGGGGGD